MGILLELKQTELQVNLGQHCASTRRKYSVCCGTEWLYCSWSDEEPEKCICKPTCLHVNQSKSTDYTNSLYLLSFAMLTELFQCISVSEK